MNQEVIDQLNAEGENVFHTNLLAHALRLVKMSRSKMSENYSSWDLHDRVYRGETIPDIEDRKAEMRKNPTKMVVPNTFAQCMTWTSFLFLMFNQNSNFFELDPQGNEDFGTKEMDCTKVLNADLRRNSWNTKLFQNLLDTARFGTGILETSWSEKRVSALVAPPAQVIQIPGIGPMEIPPGPAQWTEFLKSEGNDVRNISPYRFFPDTRHALVDFQKGEFCASEEEYSMAQLRGMARSGEVAGLDRITPLSKNLVEQRGGATRSDWAIDDRAKGFDSNNESSVCVVTKMQVWLIPNKFELSDGKKLGPEEFPILYILWYANDNRVIRCEPAHAWHNEFSWTVSQFTPDMHHTVTMGLADLVYHLQDVISWLINSHITSVRRVIQNRMLVNPAVVDTKTLDGESDIYMKKGMNVPFDRALKQLAVQDVTGGHMNDSQLLGTIMETVTGVNGNAMGQYNSGRRSAQEARVVTAGAAGRMKMHGHLLWESAYGRLGKLMLSNLRQNLTEPSFTRMIGNVTVGDPAQRFAAFAGTPEEIICGSDYFVFDSTLASEKGFAAQSLQELLGIILSNPMAGQQFDLSAKGLLEEIQRLRGGGDISRFSLSGRVAAGLEQPQMPVPVEQPTQ